MLAVLILAFSILVGTAIAAVTTAGTSSLNNAGPHGLSELTYAFTSATGNNGSAFAGLNANTRFYNLGLAVAMWLGRFGTIVPVMALAGSMAAKKRSESLTGKMPTHGPLFVGLLIGTVFLVGALTYVPALALGPAAEHLQLFAKAAP
jgi:potassium-transporting ATPase potassium-binding subunit